MSSTPSLAAPPVHVADLRSFPGKHWSDRFRLCRIGLRGNGTFWFSSDGSGRFDLSPGTGDGTCYFGTDAHAAIVEVFRTQPVLDDDISRRTLRVLRLRAEPELADTTKPEARAVGMTKEIMTITPYDLPHAWAHAWREANFDGVFHELRHDLRPRPTGVSLFGPSGPGDTATFAAAHTERAITPHEVSRTGLRVHARPTVRGLHIR